MKREGERERERERENEVENGRRRERLRECTKPFLSRGNRGMLCALRHRQAVLCAVHAMRIDCPGPYESGYTTSVLQSPFLSISFNLVFLCRLPPTFCIRCTFSRFTSPSKYSIFVGEKNLQGVDFSGPSSTAPVKGAVLKGIPSQWDRRVLRGAERGKVGFYRLRIFSSSLIIHVPSFYFFQFLIHSDTF